MADGSKFWGNGLPFAPIGEPLKAAWGDGLPFGKIESDASATVYSLSLDAGSYALTGQDAALDYELGATVYTLSLDAGAYSLAGASLPFYVLDRNFTDVVLLIGADGANGSTSFVDESPYARALTSHGGAQISTSSPLFGSGSMLLDGSDDYVSCATTTAFNLGGVFTVEAHVSLQETTNFAIISLWSATTANCSWALLSTGGNLTWRFYQADGTLRNVQVAWTPTLGQRYHIAVSRNISGKTRLRVDGVVVASNNTYSPPRYVAAGLLSVGFLASATYLNGKVDELRVTNQRDRYDTDDAASNPDKPHPRAGLSLVTSSGSFSVAGQDVSLLKNYRLATEAGAYALTMGEGGFFIDVNAYTLALDAGAYALTGRDAGLIVSRRLAVDSGAYTLSGASLLANYRSAMGAGAYVLTGRPLTFALTRRLGLDAGAASLSGAALDLLAHRALTMDAGAYTLSGQAVAVNYIKIPTLVLGSVRFYPALDGTGEAYPALHGAGETYPALAGRAKANRWAA